VSHLGFHSLLFQCVQAQVLPEDVEVLMHSTVSTCPQVQARCYPPFLRITKEMMSQGP
jgi:hypothetical protein